jgi:large subunit ribosomal protein L25
MLHLKIDRRDSGTKPEKLRKEGRLPAVFYGRKEESVPIAVSEQEFERVWREAGESTILSLEGVGEPKEALIHDVAVHPVSGKPLHADFYVIEKGRKLEVEVPLEFVGVAPAVKDLGGSLVKVLHELEIEALPKDLPHGIKVDISGLVDFESYLAVKDLALPAGVTALVDPNDIVVSVAEPKEEIEEEAPAEIDMASIEVAGEKGKEEKLTEEPGDKTPSQE